MAKNEKMTVSDWINWIVGLIITLGIAGLFWAGTFLNVPVLSMLPLVIHQIVAILLYIDIGIGILRKIGIIK